MTGKIQVGWEIVPFNRPWLGLTSLLWWLNPVRYFVNVDMKGVTIRDTFSSKECAYAAFERYKAENGL